VERWRGGEVEVERWRWSKENGKPIMVIIHKTCCKRLKPEFAGSRRSWTLAAISTVHERERRRGGEWWE
jgi:hypothetical protein